MCFPGFVNAFEGTPPAQQKTQYRVVPACCNMGSACQHLVAAPLTHTSAQCELHWRRQQSLLTCSTRMPFHSKSMRAQGSAYKYL
jgi:hypothetical protein